MGWADDIREEQRKDDERRALEVEEADAQYDQFVVNLKAVMPKFIEAMFELGLGQNHSAPGPWATVTIPYETRKPPTVGRYQLQVTIDRVRGWDLVAGDRQTFVTYRGYALSVPELELYLKDTVRKLAAERHKTI